MGKYDNLVSQMYKQGLEPDQVKSKYYNKILFMDDTTMKGSPYVEVVWWVWDAQSDGRGSNL